MLIEIKLLGLRMLEVRVPTALSKQFLEFRGEFKKKRSYVLKKRRHIASCCGMYRSTVIGENFF